MKKTLTAIAAVALLSFGTAWAAETPKADAARPADKPVAEAPASAQAASATTASHAKSSHHHKSHSTAKKAGDGSVAPAPTGGTKPAAPQR